MHNNEEIVEKLGQELKNGDVILVKASNGMKFFEICQKLQIFWSKIDIMQIPNYSWEDVK